MRKSPCPCLAGTIGSPPILTLTNDVELDDDSFFSFFFVARYDRALQIADPARRTSLNLDSEGKSDGKSVVVARSYLILFNISFVVDSDSTGG